MSNMGIFDFLRRGESTSQERTRPDQPMRVRKVYFTDIDPEAKDSILDFDLIFGRRGEGGGFGLYRASDSFHFESESDWKIIVYESGAAVQIGEGWAQAHLGRIGTSDYLKPQHREKFEVMDMPEKFVGRQIPENSEWSDEQLQAILLSLSLD